MSQIKFASSAAGLMLAVGLMGCSDYKGKAPIDIPDQGSLTVGTNAYPGPSAPSVSAPPPVSPIASATPASNGIRPAAGSVSSGVSGSVAGSASTGGSVVSSMNSSQTIPAQVAYIKVLYKSVLRRTPTNAELNYWSLAYKNAPLTCMQITKMFLMSSEAKQLQDNMLSVDLVVYLYGAALGRSPDLPGYQFWVKALAQGYSRAQLLKTFSTHPEIGNRCLTYNLIP